MSTGEAGPKGDQGPPGKDAYPCGNGVLAKIQERLEQMSLSSARIEMTLGHIQERCGLCQKIIEAHQCILYGNAKAGLITRMATSEALTLAAHDTRVTTGAIGDVLSVKSITVLMGAVGALAAAIGAAIAAVVR
jgi:hypothetical protein